MQLIAKTLPSAALAALLSAKLGAAQDYGYEGSAPQEYAAPSPVYAAPECTATMVSYETQCVMEKIWAPGANSDYVNAYQQSCNEGVNVRPYGNGSYYDSSCPSTVTIQSTYAQTYTSVCTEYAAPETYAPAPTGYGYQGNGGYNNGGYSNGGNGGYNNGGNNGGYNNGGNTGYNNGGNNGGYNTGYNNGGYNAGSVTGGYNGGVPTAATCTTGYENGNYCPGTMYYTVTVTNSAWDYAYPTPTGYTTLAPQPPSYGTGAPAAPMPTVGGQPIGYYPNCPSASTCQVVTTTCVGNSATPAPPVYNNGGKESTTTVYINTCGYAPSHSPSNTCDVAYGQAMPTGCYAAPQYCPSHPEGQANCPSTCLYSSPSATPGYPSGNNGGHNGGYPAGTPSSPTGSQSTCPAVPNYCASCAAGQPLPYGCKGVPSVPATHATPVPYCNGGYCSGNQGSGNGTGSTPYVPPSYNSGSSLAPHSFVLTTLVFCLPVVWFIFA